MHQRIAIISEGKNRQEAFDKALGMADDLVENNDFDYHSDEGRTYKLTSALGQEAVQGALASTREDFDRALAVVKRMLRDFTDEQIYQEQFAAEDGSAPDYYASRWQFAQVGTSRTYLYATQGIWGEAITNDKDYARALSDQDPKELWVTTMDFHN